MIRCRPCLTLALALCGLAALRAGPVLTPPTAALPEFNQIVLDVIEQYPTDGTHDYWWPRGGESGYDGCTEDLYFGGEKVMEGEPGRRTFCCGLTLEVFGKAYNTWLERHPEAEAAITPSDWPEFQRLWFVPAVNESGPSAAIESFGLGRTIEKPEVRPGDFVQIWRRQGSGHSVIFLNWERGESGQVTGFRYWSSQPSTDGIAVNTEHFAPAAAERGVADEHTHWGRVDPPGG